MAATTRLSVRETVVTLLSLAALKSRSTLRTLRKLAL